jgi:hypothetical protein
MDRHPPLSVRWDDAVLRIPPGGLLTYRRVRPVPGVRGRMISAAT